MAINIDDDINFLKRLHRTIVNHIAMLEQSDLISSPADIYDEIAGALVDEVALNESASHAYVYMTSAYLEVTAASDKDDLLLRLRTLEEIFAVLIQRHIEVAQDEVSAAKDNPQSDKSTA